MHQETNSATDPAEGVPGCLPQTKDARASWWPRSAPRRRLIGELVSYQAELCERIDAKDAGGKDARFLGWSRACIDLLCRVHKEARRFRGSVSVGYQALNAARRMEILDFDIGEVRAAAIELAEEANSPKLKKWRRQAISRLLRFVTWSENPDQKLLAHLAEDDELCEQLVTLLRSQAKSERRTKAAAALVDRGLKREAADALADELVERSGEEPAPSRVRVEFRELASSDLSTARVYLRRAMLVRDEGLQNNYRKTDILKQNLWIMSAFLVPAILGLLLLGWFRPLDLSGPTLEEGREIGGRLLAYVPLFGMLGACLSAILSLIRTSRGPDIAEIASHGVTTLIRPLFGASAALVAFVLVASGLQSVVSTSNAAILFISFAAGFSERLIVRAVAAVASADEESAARSGSGG